MTASHQPVDNGASSLFDPPPPEVSPTVSQVSPGDGPTPSESVSDSHPLSLERGYRETLREESPQTTSNQGSVSLPLKWGGCPKDLEDPEASASVSAPKPTSKQPAVLAPSSAMPTATVSPPSTPRSAPAAESPDDWPTRCAYCGGQDNPQPCCVAHPNTPMCDICRAVPQRSDNHRPPLAADPSHGVFHCPHCRRNMPAVGTSWPWANQTRICVTCLWATGHVEATS